MSNKFDFLNPDYHAIFAQRLERLNKLRADPIMLKDVRDHYKENPADFINDWGTTSDPRLVSRGLPAVVPFLLFDRQREMIDYIIRKWKAGEDGLIEKSRDVGASWLTMALSCTLCLHNTGLVIGFGSRKEEYVDLKGSPKSLFWKGREFIKRLPRDFRGTWTEADAPFLRIGFPDTESFIAGEAGDGIGRGDRTSVTFVDEAAHLERPELVDYSLSATTDCRIDLSSVNGMRNPFAEKRHSGRIEVFSFHWAQPLDAKILTPNGYVTMSDVSAGDMAIGRDGTPTKILGVYPKGEKEVYSVTFNDGSSTECCDEHLWSVIKCGNQRAERKHILHTLPLSEIRNNYVICDKRGYKIHNYQIPICAPVEFAKNELPIDPYILGCLLGDGSFPVKSERPIVLSNTDFDMIPLVNARLPAGCKMSDAEGIDYRVVADSSYRGGKLGRGIHNPINRAVRELGLVGTKSHTKFVPECYKTSSIDDRLDLLQGLLDTDGHVSLSDPGSARLTSVSRRLVDDVVSIVQTLGGTAKIYNFPAATRDFPGGRRHKCMAGFSVHIKLPDEFTPFKLPRKIAAYTRSSKYKVRRSIVDITLVGVKECQCIKVDSADGLYLTDACIVTHNTSDPRKDQAWYEKKCASLPPVVVAQELDLDYSASVEGVLIPSEWARACIDAHVRLGITPSGAKVAALDVADAGIDSNALCGTYGILVETLEQWSGKGADIFATTQKAFGICDKKGYAGFTYDGDGLGAGVRGDARVINEGRTVKLNIKAFRGSASVDYPNNEDIKGLKNIDAFANKKAQGAWALRSRVERTYRWVVEGKKCDPDDILSISSGLKNYRDLINELSQPTYKTNGVGKIVIDKAPDGAKSPNLFDSLMIRFGSATHRPMIITGVALDRFKRR